MKESKGNSQHSDETSVLQKTNSDSLGFFFGNNFKPLLFMLLLSPSA